ncbi:MAG: GSCFA domain-containing protein, partial [Mariniphaga sp.]
LNPFGILYNPVSIAQGLRNLLQKKQFTMNDLIRHNGLYHSFHHHGRFSSPDAEKTLADINQRIEASAEFLKHAGFLFLSFGTAWIYEYKSTGQTVSNCHKIPDREFRRFRLTPGEIVEEYRQILPELWKLNPELKVVFTVSPIRHWKDGAVENQRSKATLLLAVDNLIRGFGEDHCNYFPSYEIMMDELRDYRFYDEDMIHLSSAAINHIWGIFQQALIEEQSQKLSKNIEKIIAAVNHKPYNMFTQEHLHFLRESLKKTQHLQEKFPYLDLSCEINVLSDRINFVADKNKPDELPQV